jgi:hypothetical protein
MAHDQIEYEFWEFCKAHAHVLSRAGTHPKGQATLEKAETILRRYDEGLGLEVDKHPDLSRTGLLITAYCDSTRREAVVKLMASKPDIDGLKVSAFRPANSESFDIEIAGLKIGIDDIRFDPLTSDDDPNVLGLEIHFRDDLILTQTIADTVAVLAVSAILGEEVVMTEIAAIRSNVGGAQPFTEFVPMKMLPRLIERHRARKPSQTRT